MRIEKDWPDDSELQRRYVATVLEEILKTTHVVQELILEFPDPQAKEVFTACLSQARKKIAVCIDALEANRFPGGES